VPEYIRLISAADYVGAYMINWKSNVFPGILGRTCDRPCEPACRRGRVEEQPVAICRLKRVAADYKGDISALLPKPPATRNGKRIACVGAGPASLTVARDLAPLGYEVVVFDADLRAGGMMRSQIPKFRLPDAVIDEEVGYVLDGGVDFVAGRRIDSLKALLGEGYDAIFIGSGAPRGRDLSLPGRTEAAAHIHIGIDWLASVSFGHTHTIGRRVIVLGGGNTAMDCCRSSLRLGGTDVKVVVRSGFAEMKASSWEKEDAIHEGIPILNYHVPKAFVHDKGRLTGMVFEKVTATQDDNGRRILSATGEPDVHIECDDVLIAVGQENAFPWIEPDAGVAFDRAGLPKLDALTFQSSLPSVFFGGDSAFGPKNIITAVAHGHEAAISIDAFCRGESPRLRPPPMTNLVSQKMGIHEWSYDNAITLDHRFKVPHADSALALKDICTEVEIGFDPALAIAEAQRCLNCDVQTVFSAPACIECDACVDICPLDCISFVPNAPEDALRRSLSVPATDISQAIYVSEPLKTARIMAKDEDLCLHCGLCAERCPTGAWDMQKFTLEMAQWEHACRSRV
jgi:NADPH-dependent glutamate synthase beta subunit-like oxidoreductase